MRDCAICKHAHRVEIEAALFKVSPDNAESGQNAFVKTVLQEKKFHL